METFETKMQCREKQCMLHIYTVFVGAVCTYMYTSPRRATKGLATTWDHIHTISGKVKGVMLWIFSASGGIFSLDHCLNQSTTLNGPELMMSCYI